MKTSQSSTRERVLEFIKREGQVTVKALTDEIGITPMAIRGHLSKLERDNLITVNTVRQKLGRPLQVFSLTDKGEAFFPKDYGRFAIDLMKDVENLDQGRTLHRLMDRRMDRIFDDILHDLGEEDDPSRQMEIYADFVRKHGHSAQIEEREPGTFLLHVDNCALSQIVKEFPIICASEVHMLQRIFPKAQVSKTKSIVNDDCACSFKFVFAS